MRDRAVARGLWVTVVGLLANVASAATCGSALPAQARRVIEGEGGLVLAWAARPAPIPVDRHFALDIVVCGAEVRRLAADAQMPAHGHGMNYEPSVKRVAAGRWRAEGLMLQMPGRWRFIFDLDTPAGRQRLQQDVEVE